MSVQVTEGWTTAEAGEPAVRVTEGWILAPQVGAATAAIRVTETWVVAPLEDDSDEAGSALLTARSGQWEACVEYAAAGIPTVTNLVTTPSFEDGTVGGWKSDGTLSIAATQTEARYGSWSLEATPDGATSGPYFYSPHYMLPAADTDYAMSLHLHAGSGATGTARIDWRDDTGTKIGATTRLAIPTGGVWERPSAVVQAPAAAATAAFVVSLDGTPATSDVVRVDGVMLTRGGTLRDYFDGTIPPARWAGTANASQSVLTGRWI